MTPDYCYASAQLDSYLMQEARLEAHEAALEERATLLTMPNGEYYPWTPANVAEALGELSDDAMQQFCDYAIAGNDAKAHAILHAGICDYWQERARQRARRELEARQAGYH